MKSLQPTMDFTLSTSCDNKFSAITFDGTYLFLSLPSSYRICKYTLNLKPVCSYTTKKAYTRLCYDYALDCFWGVSKSCKGKIYKLNKEFKEIGVVTPRNINKDITLIAVSGNTEYLLVGYCDQILKVCKISGKILGVFSCNKQNYVAAAATPFTFCYGTTASCLSNIHISCIDDKAGVTYSLNEEYTLCDMTIVSNCKESINSGELIILASRCNVSHILRISPSCHSHECCHRGCVYFPHCPPTPPEPTPHCRNFNKECADIIESVALSQAALSHILNAEGEKIQLAVASCADIDELLKINSSVAKTITHVTMLEQVLYSKLELIHELCPPTKEKCDDNC